MTIASRLMRLVSRKWSHATPPERSVSIYGANRYRGWIGVSKNGGTITGWILDPGKLDAKLQVVIRADDIFLGPILADELRPRLVEKGFGDGRFGFSVPVPESKRGDGITYLSVHPVENPKQAIAAPAAGGSVNNLGNLLRPEPIEEGAHGAPLDSAWEGFVSVEETPFGEFMKPYVDDVGALLKENRWAPLAALGEDLLGGHDLRRLLFASGRALFFEKKYARAARLFAALRSIAPDHEEAKFQHAVCLARLGEKQGAAEPLRQLFASDWQPLRVGRELASVLVDLLRAAGHETSSELQLEVVGVVRKLADAQPDIILRPQVLNAVGHAGEQALAIRLFDNAIVRHPDSPQHYVQKSRFLLSVSRIEEALTISERVLERWPDNPQARFDVNVFAKLRGMTAAKETISVAVVSRRSGRFSISNLGGLKSSGSAATTVADLLRELQRLGAEWALFVDKGGDVEPGSAQVNGLISRAAAAGCIRLSPDSVMWRLQVLEGLSESGLLPDGARMAEALSAVESQYRYGEPIRTNEGVALLISRHGSIRFGGVEQFMVSAARHYRDLGYDPILVGTRPDMVGQSGMEDGLAYDFITDSVATLRKYILEKRATLLHSFPGLGYQVAQALQYHSAQFIYGIHFWRDSLGSMTSDVFFDEHGNAIPRPEFSYVLARASTAYVNSKFTQEIIEAAHGIRCPVVYSVPAD